MLKKIISLLVLTLYMHGMSGYTMSFHKCMITGFENVYTSYGLEDPCNEEENDCHETTPHFEQADCCDLQQTIVNVDDDSNVSQYSTEFSAPAITFTLFHSYFTSTTSIEHHFYTDQFNIRPPKPCQICVFRI